MDALSNPTAEQITDALADLLGYARELLSQWHWKQHEAGANGAAYEQLEGTIENAANLLDLLDTLAAGL